MEHREKVEIITGILQANEEVLSDGYHFYSGNADKTLAGIAEAILTGIEDRWIPVGERLPEVDEKVWGLLEDGTGKHNNKLWVDQVRWLGLSDNGKIECYCWSIYSSPVIAWMPFPTPPEKYKP